MTLHREYGLSHVINAMGVFTPLGVSRSPEPVIEATAEALRHFFDMSELQDAAGRTIAEITGCEWGTVTNCAAASITLSVAAAMAGTDEHNVSQLPDTTGLPNIVVIQAGHLVNFGQPVEQAIRLAGAEVVVAGTKNRCTPSDLRDALSRGNVAALVLVDSRLCQGDNVPIAQAVAMAHDMQLPAILDGAAQDMRLPELIATKADLVLISAQKYLAAPTAGIVLGRRDLVDAVYAQGKGIGRAMKAGKEAIFGALAALKLRQNVDMDSWEKTKKMEARLFAEQIAKLPSVMAELVPDPTRGRFCRVLAQIDATVSGKTAQQVVTELAAGEPPVFVYFSQANDDALVFELLMLSDHEREVIVSRLHAILAES